MDPSVGDGRFPSLPPHITLPPDWLIAAGEAGFIRDGRGALLTQVGNSGQVVYATLDELRAVIGDRFDQGVWDTLSTYNPHTTCFVVEIDARRNQVTMYRVVKGRR